MESVIGAVIVATGARKHFIGQMAVSEVTLRRIGESSHEVSDLSAEY